LFLLSYIAGTSKQTCKIIICPIVLLLSAFLIPEVHNSYRAFWVTVLISARFAISWILLPVSLKKTMMMLGIASTGKVKTIGKACDRPGALVNPMG
jgi:hypothetical protein